MSSRSPIPNMSTASRARNRSGSDSHVTRTAAPTIEHGTAATTATAISVPCPRAERARRRSPNGVATTL